jgi:hypothetical protein
MKALEQRIAALELGAKYDATQTVIRQREEEMLATLRDIRTKIAEEQAAMAGSGSGAASTTEVKALQDENERLKSTIAKQDYRIRHLIAGFEDYIAQAANK